MTSHRFMRQKIAGRIKVSSLNIVTPGTLILTSIPSRMHGEFWKQSIKWQPRFPIPAEIIVATQEEWDKPQPANKRKYINSMPKRIQESLGMQGMQTPY
jgi:hypothetical protein